MLVTCRFEAGLAELFRLDRGLGHLADWPILASDRRMVGLQLSKRPLPIVPVDLATPWNLEESAEQQSQRMDDLRHLPALQTLVSADRVQVGHNVIGPMVEKPPVLPCLAIFLDTHHVPASRRGYNPIGCGSFGTTPEG